VDRSICRFSCNRTGARDRFFSSSAALDHPQFPLISFRRVPQVLRVDHLSPAWSSGKLTMQLNNIGISLLAQRGRSKRREACPVVRLNRRSPARAQTCARDPMQTFLPIEEPGPKPQSQCHFVGILEGPCIPFAKASRNVGQLSPDCDYAPFARNALKRLGTTIVKA
jgi:hypothetical protein